jgi:hypothetical protein
VGRFTVVWTLDVQNDYVDLWIKSGSHERARLTRIAETIDRELSVSPDTHGIALPSEPELRVWEPSGFARTVRVAFEVLSDDRLVRVLRIAVASE